MKQKLKELHGKIITWAEERNFFDPENGATVEIQELKFLEEAGELAGAVVRNNIDGMKDAIGDLFVVACIITELKNEPIYFINKERSNQIKDLLYTMYYQQYYSVAFELSGICNKYNLDFVECIEGAYNEIKDRKGKWVNHAYIKEEDYN